MLDPLPQTQEQKAQEAHSEMAASLVNKVDALSRASLDLGLLRKDAKIRSARRTRARLEEEGSLALHRRILEIRQDTEAKIKSLQDQLAKVVEEYRENFKGNVEHYDNNCKALVQQAELEHVAFVEKITSNCSAYVEKVMAMDPDQLQAALKEFDIEVSKWLLPEEIE